MSASLDFVGISGNFLHLFLLSARLRKGEFPDLQILPILRIEENLQRKNRKIGIYRLKKTSSGDFQKKNAVFTEKSGF